MQIKVSPFYFILLLTTTIVLLIGGWWIFLLNKLVNNPMNEANRVKFIYMMRWEGTSFFILCGILFGLLIFLYRKNEKISNSLKTYFAAINHELKTPLASIKIQTNMLEENIKNDEEMSKKNQKYIFRIYDEINDLEAEINNSLILANLKKTNRSQSKIDLVSTLNEFESKFREKINFNISKSSLGAEVNINFNEHFLNVILRNLITNSIRHSKNSSSQKLILIDIVLKESKDFVVLEYNDHGAPFTGNINKLGDFLYLHNSVQGKGIGLFLVKELMQKEKGIFNVRNDKNLIFTLTFKKKA
ncbi:HAMP domain-containing histidine kinase [Bacteriovoracaceae bacterium]|nr:HAMP domain-containing histidine kinase [Bacteriovoracaceae bacterium]